MAVPPGRVGGLLGVSGGSSGPVHAPRLDHRAAVCKMPPIQAGISGSPLPLGTNSDFRFPAALQSADPPFPGRRRRWCCGREWVIVRIAVTPGAAGSRTRPAVASTPSPHRSLISHFPNLTSPEGTQFPARQRAVAVCSFSKISARVWEAPVCDRHSHTPRHLGATDNCFSSSWDIWRLSVRVRCSKGRGSEYKLRINQLF